MSITKLKQLKIRKSSGSLNTGVQTKINKRSGDNLERFNIHMGIKMTNILYPQMTSVLSCPPMKVLAFQSSSGVHVGMHTLAHARSIPEIKELSLRVPCILPQLNPLLLWVHVAQKQSTVVTHHVGSQSQIVNSAAARTTCECYVSSPHRLSEHSVGVSSSASSSKEHACDGGESSSPYQLCLGK